ncbi:MAG: hypothetical protein IK111_08325 [Lachnospiraceae bacterium]|nr:hypothetical protein [Lachnospiraceae bacterium]
MKNYISSRTYACINERLFFSSDNTNGLFSCNMLLSDVKLEGVFDNALILETNLHQAVATIGCKLYFFRNKGEFIDIYDIEKQHMSTIPFTEPVKDVHVIEDDIWMIAGKGYKQLFKLDTRDSNITLVTKLPDSCNTNGVGYVRLDGDNKLLVVGELATNTILIFDTISSKLRHISTTIDDIFAAFLHNKTIWIIDRNSPNIYCIDKRGNIKDYSVDIQFSYIDDRLKLKRYWNKLIVFNDSIIAIPAHGDSIAIIEDDVVKIYNISNVNWDINTTKFYSHIVIGDKLYIFSRGGKRHYVLDTNGNIVACEASIQDDLLSFYKSQYLLELINESPIIEETDKLNLVNYLEYV